jgi:ankyrin repeat protein
MALTRVPFRASLPAYESQARDLLQAWREGDADAIRIIRHNHPRFLNAEITWLPRNMSEAEVRSVTLELSDARFTLARWYDFGGWSELAAYVDAVTRDDSPVSRFESAVEGVIDGDEASLASLIGAHPELVRARSTRVTKFDPPRHRATLLHYIAANGVEGYRQKSPANAVAIARMLLEAGAEVDALADMYGGQCTTMSMLVSSTPPAEAGVQAPLVDVLVDFGASVEATGAGAWTSPLMTALTFRFRDTAEALVRRGARVDHLAAAAGLGRIDAARRFLSAATSEERHRALALAAQLGHADIVGMLLDAGEDPNRYNPKGSHAHATPLHQAVAAGHDAVVRLLIERGARLDIKDTIYQGTPLGWAVYCGQPAIADRLRAHGAC